MTPDLPPQICHRTLSHQVRALNAAVRQLWWDILDLTPKITAPRRTQRCPHCGDPIP